MFEWPPNVPPIEMLPVQCGVWVDCKAMEFVAAGRCTVKELRLSQTIRNLICDDLKVLVVVIRPGVTELKKTGFVYLLDLFGGRVDKKCCDLVCVKRLWMIGLMLVLLMLFSSMVSMEVDLILGFRYGI